MNAPSETVKSPKVVNKTPNTHSSNGPNSGYPVMGGFWDRFLAILIDSLIVGFVSSVIGGILMFSFGLNIAAFNLSSGVATAPMFSLFEGSLWLLYIFGAFFYFGYFYTKNGQTPGKTIMKLKVVRSTDLQYLSWGSVFL